MALRYTLSHRYEKSAAQLKPKIFCLCPTCGGSTYAVSVHSSLQKSLPIRYCFTCKQAIFLEKIKVVLK